MPATMVSVLPIGGLLAKNSSLSAQDFVTVIILSVGVITPIITMMSYSDDFRTMGTIFGEVRAIQALTAEKTVIMIAHRLKTVEHADQILVIDHGKIAQQGNHESLMAEDGYDVSVYARGRRLESLIRNGLRLKSGATIRKAPVKVLSSVEPDDCYDFIVLAVRENQLHAALKDLRQNSSPTIVTKETAIGILFGDSRKSRPRASFRNWAAGEVLPKRQAEVMPKRQAEVST